MSWVDRIKPSRHGTLAHEPIEPELAINALRVHLIGRYQTTKDGRYMDLQQRLQDIVNEKDPLAEMVKRSPMIR